MARKKKKASLTDRVLYNIYGLAGSKLFRPGKNPMNYSLGDAMFDSGFKLLGLQEGGSIKKKNKKNKKKPRGWGIARYGK
jgi:hypothetical protein|tara:strand:+ start:788 stop:1027 length:240 start_codon:yes stop_codon:yes gene_type:complete